MASSVKGLASEFRALYRAMCELRAKKERVSKRLRRLRVQVFDFEDGERLVLERKTDKLASLTNLIQALGSAALAKSAWDRLPESASSWFTISKTKVVNPKKAKKKIVSV